MFGINKIVEEASYSNHCQVPKSHQIESISPRIDGEALNYFVLWALKITVQNLPKRESH